MLPMVPCSPCLSFSIDRLTKANSSSGQRQAELWRTSLLIVLAPYGEQHIELYAHGIPTSVSPETSVIVTL